MELPTEVKDIMDHMNAIYGRGRIETFEYNGNIAGGSGRVYCKLQYGGFWRKFRIEEGTIYFVGHQKKIPGTILSYNNGPYDLDPYDVDTVARIKVDTFEAEINRDRKTGKLYGRIPFIRFQIVTGLHDDHQSVHDQLTDLLYQHYLSQESLV